MNASESGANLNTAQEHTPQSYTKICVNGGAAIGALALYAGAVWIGFACERTSTQRLQDAIEAIGAIPVGFALGGATGCAIGLACDIMQFVDNNSNEIIQFGYNNRKVLAKTTLIGAATALNEHNTSI